MKLITTNNQPAKVECTIACGICRLRQLYHRRGEEQAVVHLILDSQSNTRFDAIDFRNPLATRKVRRQCPSYREHLVVVEEGKHPLQIP